MLRRLYDWCIAAADKTLRHLDAGRCRFTFAESSFFPVPPDVMLIPMRSRGRTGVSLRVPLHVDLGRRRHRRLPDRRSALRVARAVDHPALRLRRQGRGVSQRPTRHGAPGSSAQGADAEPLQARDHHVGLCRLQFLLFVVLSLITRGARFFVLAFLLHRYGALGARNHREAARIVDRASGPPRLLAGS